MKRKMWTQAKIKRLRDGYAETQRHFCLRLGVDVETLRFWEQGRGAPGGSARLLMDRLLEDLETGKIRPLPLMEATA